MLWLFGILIFLASVVLGVIILIQNPKGGGLTASLGGFSNQLMGVKRTNDLLEKGTWGIAIFIGVLCIASTLFIPAGTNSRENLIQQAPITSPMTSPQQQQTAPLPIAPSTQEAPAPQP